MKIHDDDVIRYLDQLRKVGYCSVLSSVAFVRNQFRELSLNRTVALINKWIDSRKINHDHLAIAYNKRTGMNQVVTESFVNEIKRKREEKK